MLFLTHHFLHPYKALLSNIHCDQLSDHYIIVAVAHIVTARLSNKSLSLSLCLVLADGNFLVSAKPLSNEALLVAVAVRSQCLDRSRRQPGSQKGSSGTLLTLP